MTDGSHSDVKIYSNQNANHDSFVAATVRLSVMFDAHFIIEHTHVCEVELACIDFQIIKSDESHK